MLKKQELYEANRLRAKTVTTIMITLFLASIVMIPAKAQPTTIEEAKDVLAVGFDYVTEKNGIMLFRRPKRFSNI